VSASVESRQRAARWEEFAASVSSQFSTRFEFSPLTPEPFAPEMEFYPGQGVAISSGTLPALRLTNYGSSWPDPFFQITRADRPSVLTMEGRGTLRLAAGELVVLRPEFAGEWSVDSTYTTVAIHVEESLLRKYIPAPMDLVGRSLDLPSTVNEVLARITDASLALAKEGRFLAAGRNLTGSFLHMLALSPRAQAPEAHVERYAVELRRAQIKNFIQENYAKPGLSTEDIAGHLEVTPRYVQMALAHDGTTPSDYLRVCRLEAARRLLSSPSSAHRSITEIAFECGFASSAYFSTQFRLRFGRNPRSYRPSAPPSRSPRAR
jgi:AraC-like DNA-binding protein